MSRVALLVFLTCICACPTVNAQTGSTTIGINPFGSYSGGEIDSVDLSNANLNLHIPLLSYPQRGNLAVSFSIVWNSNRWRYVFAYDPDLDQYYQYYDLIDYNAPFGPRIVFDQNLVVADAGYSVPDTGLRGQGFSNADLSFPAWAVIDPTGASHLLSVDALTHTTAKALDGSGYVYTAVPTDAPTLYFAGRDPDTDGYVRPLLTPSGLSYNANATETTITDRSNNVISYNSPGIIDSVGRVIPAVPDSSLYSVAQMTTDVSLCPDLHHPDQPAQRSTTWSVPGPNNTTNVYIVCYTYITYRTAFYGGSTTYRLNGYPTGGVNTGPQSSLSSFDSAGQMAAMQSIVLPNKQHWGFVYDTSGSLPDGDLDLDDLPVAYGNIQEVQTPSGGTIDYGWAVSQSNSFETPGSPVGVNTRTVDDGIGNSYKLTYSSTFTSTGTCSYYCTVVTDAMNNDTVHAFGLQQPEIETDIYQGRLGQGTLLSKTTTSYNSITSQGLPYNFLPRTVTKTLKGTVDSVETTSFGYTPLFTASRLSCSLSGLSYMGQPACGMDTLGTILFGQSIETTTTGNKGEYAHTRNDFKFMDAPLTYGAQNLLNLVSGTNQLDTSGNPLATTTYGYDENNGSPQGTIGNQTSVNRSVLPAGTPVITSTIYNGNGMPTAVVDARTYKTQITYDSTGLYPSSISAPATGLIQHMTYTSYDLNSGLLLQQTDENGTSAGDSAHTTHYSYDNMGRPIEVDYPSVAAGIPKTTICYTDEGDVTGGSLCLKSGAPFKAYTKVSASPDPAITSYQAYDGLGRPYQSVLQSDPAGADYTDTGYNWLGLVGSTSNPYRTPAHAGDPTPGTTAYHYDALGRKTSEVAPDGVNTKYWCYGGIQTVGQPNCSALYASAAGSNWVDRTDEAGNHSQVVSDALGRVVAVVEPDPISNTLVAETDYSYDGLGNLDLVTQNGRQGYTAPGFLTPESPEQRSFTYDSLSRLRCASNPENSFNQCPASFASPMPSGVTVYNYDPNGNLMDKTDARPQTVSYTYDALNRVKTKTRSGTYTDQYFYDGQVAEWASSVYLGANLKGHLSFSRSYNPDLAGSLCNNSGPRMCDDQYFGYDAIGRQTQLFEASPSEWGNSIHSVLANYDLAGNMNNLTYPDGSVITDTYNAAGQPNGVFVGTISSPGPSYISQISYLPSGSPGTIVYGNGVSETTAQNNRLQTCEISALLPPAIGGLMVMDHKYSFSNGTDASCGSMSGNNGNIWKIKDNTNPLLGSDSKTQYYSYDVLNRVATWNTQSMGGGVRSQTFSYDSFGNVAQLLGVNMPNVAPGYDSFNHIETSQCIVLNGVGVNPSNQAYDLAGNLLCSGSNQIGNVQTYLYDAESRITQVQSQSGGSTLYPSSLYTYDAEGNRIRKDIPPFGNQAFTEYSYFNGQAIAEKDQNGKWTNYIYANGQKIAKVTPGDAPIHFSGSNCRDNCGYEGSYVPLSGGIGHVIHTGDTLSFSQFTFTEDLGGGEGGMILWFSNGMRADGYYFDQNGQQINCDTTKNQWHNRTFDLSQFADGTTTLQAAWVVNDICSSGGQFDLFFNDIAINSSTGDVIPLYTPQLGAAFPALPFGYPNQPTNLVAVAEPSTPITGVNAQQQSTHYYLSDQLGTTQMELSSGGWPVWEGQFAPFGQELDSQPTAMRYKFTGKERDAESGLDYFGARHYASDTGRFLSPDPSGLDFADLSNPQSLNLYTYVTNSPLTRIDPNGLCQHTFYTTSWSDSVTTEDWGYQGDDCDAQIGGDPSGFDQSQVTNVSKPPPAPSNGNPANPCSTANPNNLDYTSANAQQHIMQNHMPGGKGPGIYVGDWTAIKLLNQATLTMGARDPSQLLRDTRSGTYTLKWTAPPMIWPLSLIFTNNIGWSSPGNPTPTNRLVVTTNCSKVVTSYPIP